MRTRGLDAENDWIFGKGKQSYRVEKDALRQKLSTRLKSWKGDCFYDTAEGVDWNNYFDIGTKNLLDIDIVSTLNKTVGVVSVSKYTSTVESERVFRMAAEIKTVYGSLQITEVQDA